MPEGQEHRFISLRPLYEFVTQHKSVEQPILKIRNETGTAYGKICSKLASVIDIGQGFYLWGRYDKKRYWHSCYLGKAGFLKTANLQVVGQFEIEPSTFLLSRRFA